MCHNIFNLFITMAKHPWLMQSAKLSAVSARISVEQRFSPFFACWISVYFSTFPFSFHRTSSPWLVLCRTGMCLFYYTVYVENAQSGFLFASFSDFSSVAFRVRQTRGIHSMVKALLPWFFFIRIWCVSWHFVSLANGNLYGFLLK